MHQSVLIGAAAPFLRDYAPFVAAGVAVLAVLVGATVRWSLGSRGDAHARKAIRYQREGDLIAAGWEYEQAGRPKDAAELYQRGGDPVRAAVAFLGARLPLRAAPLLLSEGYAAQAARVWSEAGHHAEATTAWKMAGLARAAADEAVLAGSHAEAAALYEVVGDLRQAAGSCFRAEDPDGAARLVGRAWDAGQRWMLDDGVGFDLLARARTQAAVDLLLDQGRVGDAAGIAAREGRFDLVPPLALREPKGVFAAAQQDAPRDPRRAPRWVDAFEAAGLTVQADELRRAWRVPGGRGPGSAPGALGSGNAGGATGATGPTALATAPQAIPSPTPVPSPGPRAAPADSGSPAVDIELDDGPLSGGWDAHEVYSSGAAASLVAFTQDHLPTVRPAEDRGRTSPSEVPSLAAAGPGAATPSPPGEDSLARFAALAAGRAAVDAVPPADESAEALAALPGFRELEERDRLVLARRLVVRTLLPGEALATSDDDRAGLAVVVSGALERTDAGHAPIGVGAYVGADLLVGPEAPRAAVVRAREVSQVLVLSRAAVAELAGSDPGLHDRVVEAARTCSA